jgi:hypothetical protein
MAYSAQVLADNPLVYYRLDETSGNTVADSSGNNRTATWAATAVQKGQSSLLNSNPAGASAILPAVTTNSVATATVGDLTTGRSGLTFEAWVRFGGTLPTTSSHDILKLNGNQGLALTVSNSVLYLGTRVNLNTSSSSTTYPSTVPVSLNQTYHLVGVIEDLGGSVRAQTYVDGVLAGTSTASGITDILAWATASTVQIGHTNRTYSLQIDEAAIYGTALSAARIAAHYQYGSAFAVANTSLPSITGTRLVGQSLSTSNGTWSGTTPITYAYEWERSANGSTGWTTISGATASSYTLDPADAGQYLRARVQATNLLGSQTALTGATDVINWSPANTEAPSVSYSGPLEVGVELTGTAGTWTGFPTPTLTYQWFRSSDGLGGWEVISGATSLNYTTTWQDAGKFLRLRAAGNNSVGSALGFSTVTGPINWAPANTVQPSINYAGVLEVGNELTAFQGGWNGYPALAFDYQWQRSDEGTTPWSDISGATSSTYTPTEADGGKYLRVRVTGTNSIGTDVAYSPTTGYVAEDPELISAPFIEAGPEQLVGVSGDWEGFAYPTFTYAWEKSLTGSTGWIDIGNNDQLLNVTSEVRGFWVRVVVTATNEAGTAVAASDPVRIAGRGSTAAIAGALMVSGAL